MMDLRTALMAIFVNLEERFGAEFRAVVLGECRTSSGVSLPDFASDTGPCHRSVHNGNKNAVQHAVTITIARGQRVFQTSVTNSITAGQTKLPFGCSALRVIFQKTTINGWWVIVALARIPSNKLY